MLAQTFIIAFCPWEKMRVVCFTCFNFLAGPFICSQVW